MTKSPSPKMEKLFFSSKVLPLLSTPVPPLLLGKIVEIVLAISVYAALVE